MPSREHITRLVVELVAEHQGVPAEQLGPATHFVNDLNFDSLDRVELAMKLEDAFGLTISDADADKLQTVGDVVEHLAGRAGEIRLKNPSAP